MTRRSDKLYNMLHTAIGWKLYDLSKMMWDARNIIIGHPKNWVDRLKPCTEALKVAYDGFRGTK